MWPTNTIADGQITTVQRPQESHGLPRRIANVLPGYWLTVFPEPIVATEEDAGLFRTEGSRGEAHVIRCKAQAPRCLVFAALPIRSCAGSFLRSKPTWHALQG